jgi:MYXO-CTERM domain-containing protein
MRHIAVALIAFGGLAASANADLAFSFADPTGGRQVTFDQNGVAGAGSGLMTYDQNAAINFIIDGSDEPNPFSVNFPNARMEMQMVVFAGSSFFGTFLAPAQGFFRIYDAVSGNTILRGDATGGAFLRFGGTSSLLLSSDNGFSYTFGSELQTALNAAGNFGRVPTDPQEGTFTITDAITTVVNPGSSSIVGAGGVLRSFVANTSYSGNSATVPTPGALALVGLGGLLAARRRR